MLLPQEGSGSLRVLGLFPHPRHTGHEDALHRLACEDFLEEHPTLMRQLRCVELGQVFLRSMHPPRNLPLEPPPV